MRRFLDAIDIYGWGKTREDMVLAAIIARLNVLIYGDKGMGKTLLGLRMAEALDVASRAKGDGPVRAAKVDCHSANEEDLVGYPIPPSDQEMEQAWKNDEAAYMKTVLSPNSIANCEFIVMDEATRTPVHMQSRYLSMLEEGEVDGRTLDVEHIIGAANPISYQGTEEMDEALADRWELVIPAPEYEEMDAEDRQKIVQTRARDTHGTLPDEEASVALYEFVQEGRKAFESARDNNLSRVSQYVDNVGCLVNRGVKGKTTADDPDLDVNNSEYTSTAPIGSRRQAIIMNNIFALYSVGLVRDDDRSIAECGEIAMKHSLIHELHGSDPIPAETLKVAHDTHSGLLQSKEERVITLIENKDDPVQRASMALRLRARTEDASRYVQEAHDKLRQSDDDIRRMAFSYVLYNRIQNGDEGLHDYLNQRVMDQIADDVHEVISTADGFEIEEDGIHPDMGGVSELESLVEEYNEKAQTPKGRAAMTFAIYSYESSDNSNNRTNPMSSTKANGSAYKSIVSAITPCQDAIEEMQEVFEDMSKHQHALE